MPAKKESILDGLHSVIRLPLRALLWITTVAAVFGFVALVCYTLYLFGSWVFASAYAWPIFKWTLIVAGIWIGLAFVGDWIEDNDW